MKRISVYLILSIFSVFVLNAACVPYGGVKGNGKVAKEERSVENFKGIRVGGAFNVYLKQGDQVQLLVEADENLLPVIRTEVKSGVLVISTEEGIRNATKLNIYISCKTLENLDVSGAAEIIGETPLRMNALEIDASGASDIELEIEASRFHIDMSGAAEAEISGKASNMQVDVSGASKLEADELEVAVCNAEASGSSRVKLWVSEKLDVTASGASSVDYTGDPLTNLKESGAADVDKK